jgi:hypothetical protein
MLLLLMSSTSHIIINKIPNKIPNKIQTLITDYIIIIKDSCYCTECGVDMGSHNPRQLCGKTYCMFANIN